MFGVISAQAHLLPIAVLLAMVAIGIELRVQHFVGFLKKPQVPVIGTLVHTFTFPLIAICLVLVVFTFELPLSEPLLIGILLIAACPSGGFSNVLVLIAKADIALSVLLTSVSSVLSFVTVPLFFWAFGYLMPDLSGSIELPVMDTLLRLFLLVVFPVGIGMFWLHYQEDFVLRNTKKLQRYTQISLYLVLILILIENWDSLGVGITEALPWSIGLCLTALATGYWVSRMLGMTPTDSATIAIEGSIRNLAVAFLIATTVLERVDIAVLPSVLFPCSAGGRLRLFSNLAAQSALVAST